MFARAGSLTLSIAQSPRPSTLLGRFRLLPSGDTARGRGLLQPLGFRLPPGGQRPRLRASRTEPLTRAPVRPDGFQVPSNPVDSRRLAALCSPKARGGLRCLTAEQLHSGDGEGVPGAGAGVIASGLPALMRRGYPDSPQQIGTTDLGGQQASSAPRSPPCPPRALNHGYSRRLTGTHGHRPRTPNRWKLRDPRPLRGRNHRFPS